MTQTTNETISLVIPACNEEGNVAALGRRLAEILSPLGPWEIVFVDDGSSDRTLDILKELHAADSRFGFLSLSRNFGHQNALKAGLDHARGDCVITMDADFQHPPEVIPRLIERWREGYDIVYTVRRDDPRQSLFKRLTSGLYYRLLNRLSDIRLPRGAADFRLLDRRAAEVLRQLHEYSLFFRGLTRWIGFRQCAVEYDPDRRRTGDTKYSLRRMTGLAMTGILSFSLKPLRLSVVLGTLFALLAFAYGVYAVLLKVLSDQALPGWASVLASVLFIGGIQLIVLGIIGEYLGQLVMESKRRPHYIVRESSPPADGGRPGEA